MKFGNVSRILFKVIGTLLLAAFVFLPVTAGAEQKKAEEAIARMNTALMDSMKGGDELGFRGRYKLLSPVIRDVFALQFMGEVSMGRYWKGLSPEQKKLFMDTYTDWTVSSYAGNFNGYSGEKFEIGGGGESRGENVTVISKLVRPHEDSIDFNYTLRLIKDKWQIVDIRIEGVSQLAMTRGQFVNVMKKGGFDGLIASLKEKISVLQKKGK